ncbi:Protein of unknown function [Loktanella fryxellensis]|uniref:Lipopolysaccharide assembly protein A domain-containing protein n=1 Tax=Loktanella fryxellensis TaxID=245187 RepID=A0A1H8A9Y6_9RHOB|nr:LapA family protein [Loktanella fryxellensis]SEM67520.1 Protein of unknown function [Loktanella fryxellensis]
MKTLKYLFWGAFALVLVVIGLVNRDPVTLQAMPQAFADLFGISPQVTLPLFIVIFFAIGMGLLLGLIWEWIREYPERAENRARAKEIASLRREIAELRAVSASPKTGDDIIALLDAPKRQIA